VIGRENIPAEGGALLCGNHVSLIDPPAMGGSATRQVHFMAKEPLFRIPFIGWFIANSGTFPVRQNSADRGALRKAIELLQSGKIVGMFPEGTRNLNPEKMMPAEPGTGMIALRAQAPVIPVALVNTEKLLPPHSIFSKFARIKVVYGKPVQLDDLYGQNGREAVDEAGRRIIAAISKLLAEHRK
jgi:1-acyl-sn-glycerol-3-phosphate acyltransferase